MKVIGVVTLFLSISAILSCGPGVRTAPPAGNVTAPLTINDGNSNIIPVTNVSSAGLNPPHGKPGHRCDIAVGKPLNGSPAIQSSMVTNSLTTPSPAANPAKPFVVPVINTNINTDTTPATNFSPTQPTPALNPPHGQPGHRCDIKTGQPLNSKPAQSITTPTTPFTPAPTIAPTINKTSVAPGINPPHGQPGHRCDIKTGEPLNSKPLQSTTTPFTPAPTLAPTINKTTVAPGMNPAHGKPGHRCDLKVGAPLNSKPAPTTLTTPVNP